MTKDKKERRIDDKKTSKELYFQLNQYLFYEPKYRKLSNNARVLYSILRDRYKLSLLTSDHTDTYTDTDGNIYCILDNTEISYLLTVSEPTAIKSKKELHAVELLDEEYVKDEANRLYVLEPELTTEQWTYRPELDDLRKQKKEKKDERIKKLKEKKKSEKIQNIAIESQSSDGDLNNFSHVTKEFLEYTKVFVIQTDFNNFSKYVGKDIPNLLIDFYKEYFKTTKYAKIELAKLCEEENSILVFESIKRAIDGEPDKPIAYIKKTLANWKEVKCETLADIQNYEKEHHEKKKKQQKGKRKNTPIRREIAPNWLKEKKQQENTPSIVEDNGQAKKNSDDEKKRLDELLKKYKRD